MGTQDFIDLERNVGSSNFISVEPTIKKEFVFEDSNQIEVETSLENQSRTNEYEEYEEYEEGTGTELECEQLGAMTETQSSVEGNVKFENETEIAYNSENLVGAFLEVEDNEYNGEGDTDGVTEYTFVNGESQQIVFPDGTVLGGDCILQLVDPNSEEGQNGSHTLRCVDGTEIHINIVKRESLPDTPRDIKNIKSVLPCNSSSVKTYPPSNKNSSLQSDPTVTEVHKNFNKITYPTQEQIRTELKNNSTSCKSIRTIFKPKPNGIACTKCRREFTKPHQLEWHCETFCGTKPFRCYTCNKRFSKDRFNYHVSICRDKISKSKIITAHRMSSSDSD